MERNTTSATFLGLPPELRLLIYSFVTHTSADKEVLLPKLAYRTSAGHLLISEHISKKLPWLKLLRTCKLVYSELHAMISDAAYLSRELNHTYEVDVVMECDCQPEQYYGHEHTKRHPRQIMPCKRADAKAIALNMWLPDYCNNIREEIDIVTWIFRGVSTTLSSSRPRTDDRHRPVPRDMWLRKATIHVYEQSVDGANEARLRDTSNLNACIREFFESVWPTEDVNLYFHTKFASGPPTVAKMHLTDLYDKKLQA